MGERGTWERRTPDWWAYRLAGRELPFAHVLCQRDEGPAGAWWDAILVGGGTGKDTCLAERVSLDEAKAAVEHEAGRRPWEPGRSGRDKAPGDGHREPGAGNGH